VQGAGERFRWQERRVGQLPPGSSPKPCGAARFGGHRQASSYGLCFGCWLLIDFVHEHRKTRAKPESNGAAVCGDLGMQAMRHGPERHATDAQKELSVDPL
jgi:hypothetical protein